MCRRVECSKCNKPTYAGCGMHVDQVLRGVPHEERCKCREDARASSGQGEAASTASLLKRMFGL